MITTSLNSDFINHYAFAGQAKFDQHFNILIVNAEHEYIPIIKQFSSCNIHLLNPSKEAQNLIENLDIETSNINYIHNSLENIYQNYTKKFNLIFCSKTIAQTQNLSEYLSILKGILSHSGAISLNLPAFHTGIQIMRDLINIYKKYENDNQHLFQIAKNILNKLPTTHPIIETHYKLLQNLNLTEEEIINKYYINAISMFSIKDVYQLINSTALKIYQFNNEFNNANVLIDPKNYIHDEELCGIISSEMSLVEQKYLATLINDNIMFYGILCGINIKNLATLDDQNNVIYFSQLAKQYHLDSIISYCLDISSDIITFNHPITKINKVFCIKNTSINREILYSILQQEKISKIVDKLNKNHKISLNDAFFQLKNIFDEFNYYNLVLLKNNISTNIDNKNIVKQYVDC